MQDVFASVFKDVVGCPSTPHHNFSLNDRFDFIRMFVITELHRLLHIGEEVNFPEDRLMRLNPVLLC